MQSGRVGLAPPYESSFAPLIQWAPATSTQIFLIIRLLKSIVLTAQKGAERQVSQA